MLTIYHSNHLDVLKDLLTELIQREPPANPLENEQILVQSPGMAQWLRLELAKKLGISAGIDFPLPASFLWQMYTRILPDVPNRSAFNKEALTWKIMALLDSLCDQESFSALNQYLRDDSDGIRRFQLSGKVADIFDQYLVYRPEWITAWEAGNDLTEITGAHPWQPILWRALVTRTTELSQSPWHRANMHNRFIQKLEARAHQKSHQDNLPKRLFVFGISALPPHFVESLQALSRQTEVHLMVTNPCRHYWGDERDPKYLHRLAARKLASALPGLAHRNKKKGNQSDQPPTTPSGWFDKPGLTLENLDRAGNPLLGSMGKLGRDYFYQLHDLDAFDVDVFVSDHPSTLLGKIQQGILELNDHTATEHHEALTSPDSSLQFHSCHSPLREIEALHDRLLDMFEKNPALTPKDIIVMLPDVNAYAPSIRAVFGSINDHRRIPFAISDISASHEYPVITAFLHLLELDKSRCTAPEILELLEVPAIQSKFKLMPSNLEQLRQWVQDSGIRWGLSPDHQSSFDLPDLQGNSWEFGLKRMLMGFAMPESSGVYRGVLPLDSVQGMSAALAGQLASFIDDAMALVKQLENERTIDQWIHFANQVLERFFLPSDQDEIPLKLIRESLSHLYEQLLDAHFQEPLSRSMMVSYLKDRLNSQRSSQRFLAGQVNFCTLMPMRSIPFKVVCLLGMNDGAYPRSLPPVGFDLIAGNSQRGDRSRREDDRYLFLEALLSAQEKLYISYIGRRIQDNSERIPSALVTELLNYCEQGFGLTPLQMITEHPLQTFSPDNYRQQDADDRKPPLFSYAHEWLPASSRKGNPPPEFMTGRLPEPEGFNRSELELAELLRFYSNPCKYFFNRRLKVWFDEDSDTLEETECFAMEGLGDYQLLEEVLDTLVHNNSATALKTRLQAQGYAPRLAFGELLLDQHLKKIAPMTAHIQDLTEKPLADCEVNLHMGHARDMACSLTGWLKGVYQGGLVRYRPASIKGKDIIRTWIEHLCLNLSLNLYKNQTMHHQKNGYLPGSTPGTTHLIGLDKTITFPTIPAEETELHLTILVDHFFLGQNQPLPWFPQTSYAWLQANPDNNPDKAQKEAYLTFQGVTKKRGEREDAYIQRAYPKLEPHWESFQTLSRTLLCPALNCLGEEKP